MATQFYSAASLDVFLATQDDSLDWLFPLGDIEQTSYPSFIQGVGALAMGSVTYEWLLRHVIKPGSPSPGAWPYTQPVWVFTSRQLSGVAGGELVGQFYDAGLLDELIVQVASVTLGAGKPLLPRQISSPPLRLLSVQQFGTGFAELRYQVPHPGER